MVQTLHIGNHNICPSKEFNCQLFLARIKVHKFEQNCNQMSRFRAMHQDLKSLNLRGFDSQGCKDSDCLDQIYTNDIMS